LKTHEGIMDKYDPAKRVALVVDEWGVWANAEPGTNPAFLYQQNSFRDALVAASSLNIFNNHCDRVRVANLAQSVNVLQSMILTKGDQMLLTPTYDVFDLYQVHQDARFLPLQLNSPDYVLNGVSIPAVNASASVDRSGAIHISLVNLDPHHAIKVSAVLPAFSGLTFAGGKILSSPKVTDINTFEEPEHIRIRDFNGVKVKGGQVEVELPATAIVVITLKGRENKVAGKLPDATDLQRLNDLLEAAGRSHDYAELSAAVSDMLGRSGLAFGAENINNAAWTVFLGSDKKADLEQALAWSKAVVTATPTDPQNMDTYANLLYKLGRKQEAIDWETRALQLAVAGDQGQYTSTLAKMRQGEKTW
jgi:hypothetical protein